MRHPVTVLVDVVGGEGRALLAWFGIGVVVYLLPETGVIGPLVAVVLLAGVVGFIHRGGKESAKESELSHLQAQYADGEMTLDEFEREVELVLDDRAREIRDAVEDVGGVGPATSANIALSFRRQGGTVDDVASASTSRLESVNGVGKKRARAIRENMRGVP